MVLYSPDWINTGFSFIRLTVNLFRHPTLIEHGHYWRYHGRESHDFKTTTMADTVGGKSVDSGRLSLTFPLILVRFAWDLKQIPRKMTVT